MSCSPICATPRPARPGSRSPANPASSEDAPEIRRSLLFTGVHVHSYGKIENAVILPYADVGRGARLKNVVIDRGVRIPAGLVVGEDAEHDAQRFRRTEQGVCLITQPMIDGLSA